ncbi:hypothetical protein [Limimaricola pyoseonensis]|uniref:hypothetical protein n=1 Tax=Limimaricola pyoseonensis TaxID=521013 RepID=UPI0010427AA6|nr:hypothetical protein [Limimaricola pyoseonensis]
MGADTSQPNRNPASRNLARDEDDKKRAQYARDKAATLDQESDPAQPQPGDKPHPDPIKS